MSRGAATEIRLGCPLASDDTEPYDCSRWHRLQDWLALANRKVSIPYLGVLTERSSNRATRMRRDFKALKSLLQSHACLNLQEGCSRPLATARRMLKLTLRLTRST